MLTRLFWAMPAVLWMVALYLFSDTPNLSFTDGPSDWLIRKTGHVAAYLLLFLLNYLALTADRRFTYSPKPAILAAILTLAYAIFDEWHQSQVITRNGTPLDVGIDALGILIGLGIIGWLEWWRRTLSQVNNPISNFNYLGASVKLKQIPQLAAILASMLQGGEVVALYGDLGAGKTTFTQALAKQLGVTKAISSPTYTIAKQYSAAHGRTLYHYDLYRLDSAESLDYLDLPDKIGAANAIIVVEWPDRAPQAWPADTIRIDFTYVDEQTRKITLRR